MVYVKNMSQCKSFYFKFQIIQRKFAKKGLSEINPTTLVKYFEMTEA